MSVPPAHQQPFARLDPSDRKLIAAARRGDGPAFGRFYRRHRDIVPAFFVARTGDAALAADLTAETFAVALAGCHGYRQDARPPSRLFAIARRLLAESRRRGAVGVRARERLGLAGLELDDDDLERIGRLRALLPGRPAQRDQLERLPEASREALRALILDELEHPNTARGLRRSPAARRPGRGRDRTPIEGGEA